MKTQFNSRTTSNTQHSHPKKSSDRRDRVIAIALMLLFLFVITHLAWICIGYMAHSFDCKLAESYGQELRYTANGYVNWTDDDVEWYNHAQHSKQQFIQNNLFAKFLSFLGSNWALKIFQVILVIAIPVFAVYCWYIAFKITKRIIFRALRKKQKIRK